MWCRSPLIPALQKQMPLCKSEASLIYTVPGQSGLSLNPPTHTHTTKGRLRWNWRDAQELRALAVHLENLGSIPSIYMKANNHL